MADGIQLNKGYDGDVLDAWDDTANESRKVQKIIVSDVGPCEDPLLEYVDSVGDGSGTINFNIDGTPAVTYLFTPPAAKIARIRALVFGICSATQPEPDEFQDAPALVNGIDLFATISAAVVPLCGGVTMKNNLQMSTVFHHSGRAEFLGTKKMGIYIMRFHMDPLRLIGEDGDFLSLVIQDDLSALDLMYAVVSGTWEK